MTLGAQGACWLALAIWAQPMAEAEGSEEGTARLARPAPDAENFTRWTLGRLRLAAGPEWDTNARRAVQGASAQFPDASRPFEVVGDGLVRVIVDSAAGLRFGRRHGLRGHYVLGAKRFFNEMTEDLLVQEVGVSTAHSVGDSAQLSVDATYKGSRIRSGLRDYDVLTGGLGGTIHWSRAWTTDLQARLTRFNFAAERRFDFWGPRASAGLRFSPHRRVSLSVRGGVTARFFDGQALVEGVFNGMATNSTETADRIFTFCEDQAAVRRAGYDCTPAGRRRDIEGTIAVNLSYRGAFLLSGQYLLRLQRSNSDFENIDRHRVEATATVALPWQLTVNVLGTLQFNQGVSITDQKFLADADENQNSLNLGVKRALNDGLYVEARYALFANQFSAADVTFSRHTVYLGLGFRQDLVEVSR